MKILLFADLHYFCGDISTANFDTNKKLVRYAMPMLQRFIQIANEEYPADLCVNLGDLIQDDRDKQRDLKAFSQVYQKLSDFRCPCYSILGNHDLKMMDCIEDLAPIVGNVDSYSLDVQGYHLVFLQPQLRPELGIRRGGSYKTQYLSEETIAWLEKDLAENKLPALVFLHFPLSEDATVEDECLFLKNRAEVKSALKNAKNLLGVFAGHQHKAKYFEEDGVSYWLSGALVPAREGEETPCGEYLQIELVDKTVQVCTKKIPISE